MTGVHDAPGTPVLVWFRQDLRMADQAALAAAVAEGMVAPVYILDDESPGDRRMGGAQRWWLHHSLAALAQSLERAGSRLILRRGRAIDILPMLAREVGAHRVHALRHYEPWWQAAEADLATRLDLSLHDGNFLAPPDQVRTHAGGRYRMFTPWWRALKEQMPPARPTPAPDLLPPPRAWPESDVLEDWNLLPSRPNWAGGFQACWTPGEEGARDNLDSFIPNIADYGVGRDFPAREATSAVSPHLHFGEISPATIWYAAASAARAAAEPFLREVGWRDFAANMIDQFPDYGTRNGRDIFDSFPWRSGVDADADFEAWSRGGTGYPIVDAGMRQLWATGWMHNRVRMIVASFLVKHLLIDWRRGERWFWDTLVDADYANNSQNWQWVAGTGVDSAPFDRMMAPLVQSERFDAISYIRRWVPELADLPDRAIHDPHGAGMAPVRYPQPLIGHRAARERALAAVGAMRVNRVP